MTNKTSYMLLCLNSTQEGQLLLGPLHLLLLWLLLTLDLYMGGLLMTGCC
jgi:hypothetical protein